MPRALLMGLLLLGACTGREGDQASVDTLKVFSAEASAPSDSVSRDAAQSATRLGRPWVVLDSFGYDFEEHGEGMPASYLLHKVAIRLPHGVLDTVDFPLGTNPGWFSDSSLLLVAVMHRLPPDSVYVPEVIFYYEYRLGSGTFRRAKLPAEFGTVDISPDGLYAVNGKRDTGGDFFQLWRLPAFQVVNRSEYIGCWESDAPPILEWKPAGLAWDVSNGCTGIISYEPDRGGIGPR